MAQELLEPRLIEEVDGVVLRIATLILYLERLGEHEPLALLDAAREMVVDVGIPIDVVEPLTVGTVHIDSPLPRRAPVLDVGTRERFRGALYFCHQLRNPPAVGILGEVVVAILGVYDVLLRLTASHGARYVLSSCHSVTS